MTRMLPRSADAPTSRPVKCVHTPHCPPADSADHDAARIVAYHPEQGWNLLCNGVVVFEDTGEILPTGQTVAPHRPDTHCGCTRDSMCETRTAQVRQLLTTVAVDPALGGVL